MRILITGATGFLGSHLAMHFTAQGHEVIVLRRPTSPLKRLEAIKTGLSLHVVDDLWANPGRVLDGVEAIVHTAANYGRNNESLSELFNTNTVFPLRLLDVAIKSGINSFINTGSALPHDFNAYSRSKGQFAEWGKYFVKHSGTTFINFLLDHVYGPGDDSKKFCDYVIETCLTNKPELHLTAGEQTRDFIFIDDVVAAYSTLLRHIHNGMNGYHDIPLGSGHAVTVREFVGTVHKLTKSTTTLHFGALPYRDNEVMFSEANTSQLRSLGWVCSNTLQMGLEKTIRSKQN